MRAVALATVLLLLVPAIAMRFTTEVHWGLEDFSAAAALLFGAGAGTIFGFGRIAGTAGRAALVASVAFGVALVWAELAVGIFT